MNLPSKELLSELLGYEANIIDDNGTLFVLTRYGAFYEDKCENDKNHPKGINIYELEHMCKEFAFSNKWLVNERQSITGKYEYQCMSFSGNMFTPSFDNVFDLCQWILENK